MNRSNESIYPDVTNLQARLGSDHPPYLSVQSLSWRSKGQQHPAYDQLKVGRPRVPLSKVSLPLMFSLLIT